MQSPLRQLPAACLAAFLTAAALADSQQPNRPPLPSDPASDFASSPQPRPSIPSSFRRVVCRYDFEEAQTVRTDFPLDFHNLAEQRGYPKFGRMTLASDTAYSGTWAFRFDLDGSSLAAGVPWGILPVIPFADYAVSVNVRTAGLLHARAQLAARLYDADRQPIPGSLAESPLTRTDGAWSELSIVVPGQHPDAAWLGLELQLLQPTHFPNPAPDPNRPLLTDFSGSAWFDDLVVWHLPTIEFSTNDDNNIITAPDTPQLHLLVRDVTNEPLTLNILVRDLNGAIVFERTLPAPRGRLPFVLELPLARFGWYRAELLITTPRDITAADTLDFVLLPQPAFRHARQRRPLAVLVPFTPVDHLTAVPALVRQLGVGSAVVAVWDQRIDQDPTPQRFSSTRRMIQSLLASDTELAFALDTVPRPLAHAVGVNPAQVLDLLAMDPSLWRSYLDEILVNFGLRVQRWQLGRTGDHQALSAHNLAPLLERASQSLSQFIPDPQIIIPINADRQSDPSDTLEHVNLAIPYEVQPAAVAEYVSLWQDRDPDPLLSLQVLPPDLYSPRQQTIDLLLRGLYAWRHGLTQIAIDAPWRFTGQAPSQLQPRPAFALWRGLADALRDRRFAGRLPVDQGIHCWLLQGASPDDHALVIWADQRQSDPPRIARLVLADHPVRTVDPFGNARVIPLDDGLHELPVTQMPLFVQGIDLHLAQFRAAFALDPPFVPATYSLHEHDLVLHNSWDHTIAGDLRLLDTAGCRITPRRQEFIIRPHQDLRLPVNVIFDRGVVAGPKRIDAEIRLESVRCAPLHVYADIEVGWRNIELTASWHLARDASTGHRDLIISQYIRNRGDHTVNLEAFLRAPGVRQNRRPIPALQPDTTVVRNFHIPRGATLLAGKTIRLGVAERDGAAQLNHLLNIPAFLADADLADADLAPRPPASP